MDVVLGRNEDLFLSKTTLFMVTWTVTTVTTVPTATLALIFLIVYLYINSKFPLAGLLINLSVLLYQVKSLLFYQLTSSPSSCWPDPVTEAQSTTFSSQSMSLFHFYLQRKIFSNFEVEIEKMFWFRPNCGGRWYDTTWHLDGYMKQVAASIIGQKVEGGRAQLPHCHKMSVTAWKFLVHGGFSFLLPSFFAAPFSSVIIPFDPVFWSWRKFPFVNSLSSSGTSHDDGTMFEHRPSSAGTYRWQQEAEATKRAISSIITREGTFWV